MTALPERGEATGAREARSQLDELHDGSNARLLARIPKEQLDRVMSSDMCDIDPTFLGFVGIYERLAQIIPWEWTVIDLGCAYASQSFFFDSHKSYVGVDIMTELPSRFSAPNSLHHLMSIKDFIDQFGKKYDGGDVFAICSYVPPWGDDNVGLVRNTFRNVFTYYPCRDEAALAFRAALRARAGGGVG